MLVKKTIQVEMKGLGAEIKEARRKLRGIKTIDQICAEVGLSKTYWYDIEKEEIRGSLSDENLRKIEKVLNVDLHISFKAIAAV